MRPNGIARWRGLQRHALVDAERLPADSTARNELDAERTAANPEFPAILAAARERRAFIRALAAKRPTARPASPPYRAAVDAYVMKEVLPYVPDAWVDHARTNRLRDPAHPPVLPLRPAPAARGDRRRDPGAGGRDPAAAAGRDRVMLVAGCDVADACAAGTSVG